MAHKQQESSASPPRELPTSLLRHSPKKTVSIQEDDEYIPLEPPIVPQQVGEVLSGVDYYDGRSRNSRHLSLATSKPKKRSPGVTPTLDPVAIRRYVAENARFTHRQCGIYVRDVNSDNGNCQCGRGVNWHEKNDVCVDKTMVPATSWNAAMHSKQLAEPTTFGFINFHGFGQEASKSAPYIRLDYTTSRYLVWELLSEYWCMPLPKLIISVTGGAKKFHLRDKLKSTFKRGLVSAATTTSAWIVTGGTGAGVMEFVGEAVKEYVLATGGSGQNVVVLGIATWGIVKNKQALIGQPNRGRFPAHYTAGVSKDGGAPLDHNHTHFILVDDGTEGKYGGEIEFRTDLEKYISDNCRLENATSRKFSELVDVGENVPLVTLMLEGGPNTIKTALEAIKRNTPVVIIEGSGRAADLIAEAFHVKDNKSKEAFDEFWRDFNDKLRVAFGWTDESDDAENRRVELVKRDIQELLEHRHMITIFALESGDSKNEIDHAILNALLKANKSNVTTQLNLALAWNRCDVAQDEIFNKENMSQWQGVDLSEAMFTALRNDQPDFVQLFLDSGIDLKQFLTVRRLRDLYHKVVTCRGADASAQLLRHLLIHIKTNWQTWMCSQHHPSVQDMLKQPSPVLLEAVGKVVRHLLQDRQDNIYKGEKFVVEDEESAGTVESPCGVGMHFETTIDGTSEKDECDFINPEKELFIWAILLNRKELALLFWKAGIDHIGGALTASSMLKSLSESADEQEELDLSQDIMSNADDFESLAVGVLNECYLQDRTMAHKLLVRELDTWGKTTLLTIADSSEQMDFMGHTACQHLLNKIWRGKMALYTSSWKILANLFIPFIVMFIKFSTGDKDSPREKRKKRKKEKAAEGTSPLMYNSSIRSSIYSDDPHLLQEIGDDTPDSFQQFYKVACCGKGRNTIRLLHAIYYYHTAPIVKFCYHTISQLIFIALFSYFVLCDLRPLSEPNSPSVVELIVWVWSATLNVEELRQFATRDAKSLHYKLAGYLSSAWNVLDLIIQSLFFVSILLRFALDEEDFIWTRTFYCITLSLYYIRFMQVFYVNKNVGPKVIMIRHMLTDLMFFLCILIVFLVAFGVASQALRYPNSSLGWGILVDVVYMPYWQMYGELFLEDLHGDVDGCSSNQTEWELNPEVTRCPEQSHLVVALLALYMILTNVLLLNLLIAMFSHTFQLVQDNSEKVWRFYRYGLIHEFFDRPTLAPPLIIFSHLWRLLKYMRRRCAEDPKTSNDFKVVYAKDDPESNQLTIFERAATERHYFHQRISQDGDLIIQVNTAKDRIEKVIEDLDEVKDKVTYRPDSFGTNWNFDRYFDNQPSSFSHLAAPHHHHHQQHHSYHTRHEMLVSGVGSGSGSSSFIEHRIKHLEEQITKKQRQLEDKMTKQERQLTKILDILQNMKQQTEKVNPQA